MRDTGEPLSRGQVDRRAVEARALREALFGVLDGIDGLRSRLHAVVHPIRTTVIDG